MNKTEKLSIALQEIQNEIIGLYYNSRTDTLEPVINNDNNLLTIITISNLFGLQIEHREGKIITFPENKTLSQMIEKPIEFQEWFNNIK